MLQHALAELDPEQALYDFLLLLDPTSTGRLPEDAPTAHAMLADNPRAAGVAAVSAPRPNPDGPLAHEGAPYPRHPSTSSPCNPYRPTGTGAYRPTPPASPRV